jgi:DNA polymerase-3 subunit epsilon
MRNRIYNIGYELTGNELVALLLESDEIKKFTPFFNRASRRSVFQWGLYQYIDQKGYLRLKIGRNDNEKIPLTTFNSQVSAKSHLFTLTEAFNLCQKLCGLFDTKHACFHYNIKQCNGACIGKESPEDYNMRILQATEPYRLDKSNFLIIDKGRSDGEKAVVVIENGLYKGFGFIDFEMNGSLNTEELRSCIKKYPDNRDVQQIIRGYVKRNKSLRVIDL